MVNPNDPFIAPDKLYYARWLDWFLGEEAPDTYCNWEIRSRRKKGHTDAEIDAFLSNYTGMFASCGREILDGTHDRTALSGAAIYTRRRSKGASPSA